MSANECGASRCACKNGRAVRSTNEAAASSTRATSCLITADEPHGRVTCPLAGKGETPRPTNAHGQNRSLVSSLTASQTELFEGTKAAARPEVFTTLRAAAPRSTMPARSLARVGPGSLTGARSPALASGPGSARAPGNPGYISLFQPPTKRGRGWR